MDIRKCIELDRGIALHVITTDEYEKLKGEGGTASQEAEDYGIVLFDSGKR